jgi:acyl-CoA thioester hydrolase
VGTDVTLDADGGILAFRFYLPLEVRYGDIDAQAHVNNARYFTYMEQGRVKYLQHLGLWDGRDFRAIGIILAEASCTYKSPIQLTQRLRIGVRTDRIGNKSIEFHYSIEDEDTGQVMATGRTVQVTYDYHRAASVPVPEHWREIIQAFEAPD